MKAEARQGREQQFGRRTRAVLVVACDELTRSTLVRNLDLAGYRVMAAGNAMEAIQILGIADLMIDLVLTEFFATTRDNELIAECKQRGVSVIAMHSADARGSTHDRGFTEPRSGVQILEKPFSREKLMSTVDGAWRR